MNTLRALSVTAGIVLCVGLVGQMNIYLRSSSVRTEETSNLNRMIGKYAPPVDFYLSDDQRSFKRYKKLFYIGLGSFFGIVAIGRLMMAINKNAGKHG
jgi:hypothetical protein